MGSHRSMRGRCSNGTPVNYVQVAASVTAVSGKTRKSAMHRETNTPSLAGSLLRSKVCEINLFGRQRVPTYSAWTSHIRNHRIPLRQGAALGSLHGHFGLSVFAPK